MTQFPSQPAYPQYNVPPPPRQAPWSGSAIAGFIISFFGCSIIGGLLGIILGIVGIISCRGGRRRGMILSILAIPIALLTLAPTVLVGAVFFTAAREIVAMRDAIVAASQNSDKLQAADIIRQYTSDDFNDDVSKEALAAWLTQLEVKHGRLSKLTLDQQNPFMPSQDDYIHLNADGKFVNGSADVTVVFDFPIKIVDIEVDSSSPREPSEAESK